MVLDLQQLANSPSQSFHHFMHTTLSDTVLDSVGMKLALADINESKLKTVEAELVKLVGEANVIAIVTDVSKLEDVQRLRDRVFETWGEVR